MLCADGYLLALPLGQYPFGILPDRRHQHQHNMFRKVNYNKHAKAP